MRFYQVTLPEGVYGEVEVSADGVITRADAVPVLRKTIGLRFTRFSLWVKDRGGEIIPVRKSLLEMVGRGRT
jgi:hypothetical protein